MKRLLFWLLAAAAVIPAIAEITPETDSAFFIYRNDGVFDAFKRSQVDSISFSRFDLEGVEYDHFVTQEVWSRGSVTRTPLEAIDNLGFVQPEVVVSSDLMMLTAEHDPYIVEADTLSFTMRADIPESLQPRRKNVVVAQADCQSFPNGIMARVTGISYNGDGDLVYECEPASLDDIYDQIVVYTEGEADVEEVAGDPASAPRRISKEFSKEIWNKTFEGTIEKLGGTTYYANDVASCEIKVCKTLGTPLYASITLNNTFTGRVNLDYSTEKDYEPDPVQIGPTIKVGRITFPHPLLANLIWLEPQIRFSGYFKAHGELDIDFGAHLDRSDKVNLTYSDKQWSINHTPTMDCAVDSAMLSMRGFVEVGLIPDITLALNGSATGVGITGKVGLKQTLDLIVDAKECFDTSVYEGILDTHTDTYLTYATSIYVQSGLFDKDTPRKSYEILDSEKKLLEKYIFPTFGTATYQQLTDDSHLVKVEAQRDVLLPLRLGMSLYDEDENLVQVSTDTIAYNKKQAATYAFRFNDLDLSKPYRAYPMIHLGKLSLRATPAYTVNRCPVQVDSMKVCFAYFDRNDDSYPNTMVYNVHASLRDSLPADATEWGVAVGSVLYKCELADSVGYVTLASGAPDSPSTSGSYRLDYYNFIFEMDKTARAYVKRVNESGRETIMYSDPFSATLRYTTPPAITYTDPKVDSTTLITQYTNSSGEHVMQFKSVASYTMTLQGSLWVNYIDGGVSGNYSLSSNPEWRPTYDGVWRTTWDTTYYNTDVLDHSNWHNLHLRTGRLVQSDRLNWVSGTSGYLDYVTVTPSLYPAVYTAPAACAPAVAQPVEEIPAEALPEGMTTTPLRTSALLMPVIYRAD